MPETESSPSSVRKTPSVMNKWPSGKTAIVRPLVDPANHRARGTVVGRVRAPRNVGRRVRHRRARENGGPKAAIVPKVGRRKETAAPRANVDQIVPARRKETVDPRVRPAARENAGRMVLRHAKVARSRRSVRVVTGNSVVRRSK
jgi:hypothetical protein